MLNCFIGANFLLSPAIKLAQTAALAGKLTGPGECTQQVVYLKAVYNLAGETNA